MIKEIFIVTHDRAEMEKRMKYQSISDDIDFPPTKTMIKRSTINVADIEQVMETEYEDLNEFDLPVDLDGTLIEKTSGVKFIVTNDYDTVAGWMKEFDEQEEQNRKQYLQALSQQPVL